MFRKIAVALVAGSLVFAAQVASADDTQFDVGGGRYLGAAALPFHATGMDGRMTAAPEAASQRLESTHAAAVTESAPAPYRVPDGYFN